MADAYGERLTKIYLCMELTRLLSDMLLHIHIAQIVSNIFPCICII